MVSVFPYLRYALSSVVRNRRKTLTSGIGIMLAVMIILTEILAITLQSRAMMVYEMEDRNNHFSMSSSANQDHEIEQMDELITMFQEWEGISRYYYSLMVLNNGEYSLGVILGGRTQNLSAFIHQSLNSMDHNDEATVEKFHTYNSEHPFFTPLERGTINLQEETAKANNLSPGDQIEVSFIHYNQAYDYRSKSYSEVQVFQSINQTFTVDRIFPSYGDLEIYQSDYNVKRYNLNFSYHQVYPFLETLHFHPLDLLNLSQHLEVTPRVQLSYSALLDREVYAKQSLVESEEQADGIKLGLNQEADRRFREDEVEYWVSTNYAGAIESVKDYTMSVQLILFALTIPMMIIGVYIAHLGSQLFLRERRRELGMLKVRGTTSGQISSLLNLESVLIGFVAASLGIILAVVGVKLFMPYTQAADYLSELPWHTTGLGWFNVIMGILLGIFLMWVSSYRAFRRMARVEAAELLANFSRTEEAKEYRPRVDLGLLGVTIFFILLFSVIGFEDDSFAGTHNIFLELLAVIFLLAMMPVLVLTSPYIFIFTLVRLATRWSTRPYGYLVDGMKRFTDQMHELVRLFVMGGERRVTNVTKVLAITMGFLIFTSTFYYAERDYEKRVIKAENGSDIHISMSGGMSNQELVNFQAELMNQSGVERTSALQNLGHLTIKGKPGYTDEGTFNLILADAKNYSRITFFERSIWVDGSAKDIEDLAGRGDRCIITAFFADKYELKVGDTFQTYVRFFNESLAELNLYEFEHLEFAELKVMGILHSFPGQFDNNKREEWDWYRGSTGHPEILLDRQPYLSSREAFLQREGLNETETRATSTNFLVKLKDGVDHIQVGQSIQKMDSQPSIGTVTVTAEELDKIENVATTNSWLMVLKTQMLAIIYMSFMVAAAIVYIGSLDRQTEMANVQLKGTTRKQLLQLQMTEGSVILIYSLLVGLLAGILGAMAWINVLNKAEGGNENDIITRSLIPSLAPVPYLIIMLLISLVTYYLVCMRFIRTDLTKFIRLRSG